MKKFITSILLVFTIFTQSTQAEMDPRAKALGTMAVYGTIGGALLGTAALAFDADGRAVAVGASLGLYAGLIFGGYVVGTHMMKKRQYNNRQNDEYYYPDTEDSPYEEPVDQGYYDDGQGYQSRMREIKSFDLDNDHRIKNPGQTYYVQLLNFRF